MSMQRLDKLIAGQLNLSRADAKKLIASGRVTVNGAIVRDPEHKANPDTDRLAANNTPLTYKKTIYLMLNKPAGVISATRDGRQKTVLDLVPAPLARKGLFPAGRLDKDTVGFVLLTDDGVLAHRMLSPKNHVPKTYLCALDVLPDEEGFRQLSQGVDIGDAVCRPARVRTVQTERPNTVEVIITEGMYHQIKRMFAAVGSQVLYLKRTAIGALPLDENLPEGECKEIFHKDVEKLLTRKIP